ncbi:MAG TPA: hypothetical protein DC054_21880 [Blastocatellia bacterium]|nr:hypothetical protein [Blastocatellia bacterium]
MPSTFSLRLSQRSSCRIVRTALVLILLPTITASQALQSPLNKQAAELLYRQGIASAEKGDYKAAIRAFAQAIRLNPHYAEAYYHRGVIGSYGLCVDGIKDPVKDFEAAIKWNPGFAEAQWEVGRAQEKIDNLDLAIQINPKYAEAYYWRGKLKAENAIEYLNEIRSGRWPDIGDSDFTLLKVPSTKPNQAIAFLSSLIRLAITDYTESIRLRGDYSEAYFARGTANFGLKEYQAAVNDFTRVVELRPRNGAAYERRGLARLEMGDQDGALKDFIQSIKFAPSAKARGLGLFGFGVQAEDSYTSHLDKIDKSSNLAEAYYDEGKASALVWNDTEMALESFTRAMQLGLKKADVFYQRGLLISEESLDLRKEWKGQAARDFTQAILLDPGNPDYYYSRGMERFKSADYRAAIADFTEAIRLSSSVTDIHLWRGRGYYSLGDHQNAIADLALAIQLNPQSPAAYYYRGRAYDDDDKKALAVADYLAAVRYGPPDKEHEIEGGPMEADVALLYDRGLARLTMSRVKDNDEFSSDLTQQEDYVREAGEDFSALIKVKPNWGEVYYQRWRTNHVTADLDQAIRIKPDFVEAYTARAWEGTTADSRADVEMAIRLKPDWPRPYYLRGRIELLNDHFQRNLNQGAAKPALADFTHAIDLDPDFVEAYEERGNLRWGLENSQGALADFTQVIRLKPNDVVSYQARARLRLELKDYQGAIDDLTRIIELASANSTLVPIYGNRARARYEVGDGRGSVEDCEEKKRRTFYCPICSISAQIANAKKADSFFEKGLNLSRRGDNGGAAENFQQAARLYHAAGKMTQYQKTEYELSKL